MAKTLQLPLNVVSRGDINRLERELMALEDFMRSAAARQAGVHLPLPMFSRLFDELVQLNKLNALLPADRARLKAYFDWLKQNAPVIHMSFGADPSPLFMQKLITWLRQNIHPALLLGIGLQPTIGAGCIVRTANRYFDFSLRQRFVDKRDLLIVALRPKGSK